MNNSLVLTFELIILAVLILGWLGMLLYLRRKRLPVTKERIHDLHIPTIFLCIIVLCVFLGLSSYGGGEYMEQATPEKTPSNVFLILTRDTTPEELCTRSQEQGLYCIGPVQDGKTSAYYILVDTFYLSHQEANGVLLKVRFSDDAGCLLSAKLTIRTNDGRAKCWYYPTEDTEWFRPTGYTLTTKTGVLSLPRTLHPETAQDAIDYVYEMVYPDGEKLTN